MKKNVKEQMLQFLANLKKCRKSVLYPVIAAAVIVLGCVIVLPSLADDMSDESTEVVEDIETEESEPTESPEVTEEPTEEPTAEPTEEPTVEPTAESQQTAEPKDETEDTVEKIETDGDEESKEEKQQSASSEQDTQDTDKKAAAEDETTQKQDTASESSSGNSSSGNSSSGTRKKAVARTASSIPTPQFHRVEPEDGDTPITGTTIKWTYLSPGKNANVLKVKTDNYDDEGGYLVKYQWYCDGKEDGNNNRIYTISADTDAGEHEYECEVTYYFKDGSDSKSAKLTIANLTVEKLSPSEDDFVVGAIPATVYYQGGPLEFEVKPAGGINGMGSCSVAGKNDGEWKSIEDVGTTYDLYIRVEEGDNYFGSCIDLHKKVTVQYLPTPDYTVTGTKGKKTDGVQWYKDALSIKPKKTDYTIADQSEDYKSELKYDTEGSDIGLKSITFKNSKGELTKTIPVSEISTIGISGNETIGIDTVAPTGTFKYNTEEKTDAVFANGDVTVAISPNDATSKISKCEMAYSYSKDRTPTGSGRKWEEKESLTVVNEGNYIVYAKLTDNAGNTQTLTSQTITIDEAAPVIKCGSKALKENKKYIADEKTFNVSDTNLSKVTVTKDGDKDTKTVENGTCTFTLTSPDTDGDSFDYTITAEDEAGNVTEETITMENPNLDVTIDTMEFKTNGNNPVYGYSSASLGISLVLKKGTKYNVQDDPVIEAVTPIADAEGKTYFTYDQSSKTVKPVEGLDADNYSGSFRVDYKCAEEESSTTFKCEMTVDKKPVTVSYVANSTSAYYNTVPSFGENAYKFDGFVGKDTAKSLNLNVSMDYGDGSENWQSITETPARTPDLAGKSIQPNVSETKNYIFNPQATDLPDELTTTTTLKVTRRPLEDGLTITGTAGANNWYISDVTVGPASGYVIYYTEDTEEQDALGYAYSNDTKQYTQETKGETISFYIQNSETGEISSLMTKTIKIDKTAPTVGDIDKLEKGEITIEDSTFREFLNTITFGKYFNETKAVTINGKNTEDISNVAKDNTPNIQYYLGSSELSESGVTGVTSWTDYSGKFYLDPEELLESEGHGRVVVYAKLTNDAGLSTYISSDGMVFDNKCPELVVEGALNSSEEKNNTNYVAEELKIQVKDDNLASALLYEGESITGDGTDILNEDKTMGEWSVSTEDWEIGDSKTYTIVATDVAQNLTKKIFTVIKPVYDITTDSVDLGESTYGYSSVPSTILRWKNTSQANADATISEVKLSDSNSFEVTQEDENRFVLAPKKGLKAGKYTTDVTLVYNRGKEAKATCSFTVDKAVLKASYLGQDVYYYTTPDFDDTTVRVTGFLNGETAKTADGYQAPQVTFDGVAKETCILTPSGGKADNYEFEYESGVLTVTKRASDIGADGQYDVEGTLSDTGWYLSDITIKPSDGYKISLNEKGKALKDSIVLTKDTGDGKQEFYLVDENTGEMMDKAQFSYKKDVVAPEISGVEDGNNYEENSRDVTVSDSYLSSVTVNGTAQTVVDGKATFTLTAKQRNTVYVIVAADRAGNVTQATTVLKQPSEVTTSSTDSDATALTGTNGSSGSDSSAGSVKKKVQVVEGAPSVAITTSNSDITTAVLTDEEQTAVSKGSDVDIELRVKNVDGNVSQADKEAIIAILGNYKIGQYMDITLWKTVGSSNAKKVTETRRPIAVTVTVPTDLRNTDSTVSRKYALFRVHDGKATKLEDQDSVENTVTFYTDEFSVYALAYLDSAKETTTDDDEDTTSGTSKTTASTLKATTSGSTGYLATTSPETGDKAPLLTVIILLIIAMAGAVTIVILKRKNSDAE